MKGTEVKETIDNLRDIIKRHQEMIKRIEDRCDEINKTIVQLQESCEHKWEKVIKTAVFHKCIFCDSVQGVRCRG